MLLFILPQSRSRIEWCGSKAVPELLALPTEPERVMQPRNIYLCILLAETEPHNVIFYCPRLFASSYYYVQILSFLIFFYAALKRNNYFKFVLLFNNIIAHFFPLSRSRIWLRAVILLCYISLLLFQTITSFIASYHNIYIDF
jgi:hypothetical protein